MLDSVDKVLAEVLVKDYLFGQRDIYSGRIADEAGAEPNRHRR